MIVGAPLALVGMVREARIARAAGLRTVIGAAGLSGEAVSQCQGIVSFGLAGSLDPHLKVGDLIVATEVVAGGRRFSTDPFWTDNLLDAMPTAQRVRQYGAGAIVGDKAAREALREAAQVDAVDTESHHAAAFAHQWGLPFAVVRAVSDDADRTLPHAALVGLGADGRPDLGAVLASLARRPTQFPSLLRAAVDAERAFQVLANAARTIAGVLI